MRLVYHEVVGLHEVRYELLLAGRYFVAIITEETLDFFVEAVIDEAVLVIFGQLQGFGDGHLPAGPVGEVRGREVLFLLQRGGLHYEKKLVFISKVASFCASLTHALFIASITAFSSDFDSLSEKFAATSEEEAIWMSGT